MKNTYDLDKDLEKWLKNLGHRWENKKEKEKLLRYEGERLSHVEILKIFKIPHKALWARKKFDPYASGGKFQFPQVNMETGHYRPGSLFVIDEYLNPWFFLYEGEDTPFPWWEWYNIYVPPEDFYYAFFLLKELKGEEGLEYYSMESILEMCEGLKQLRKHFASYSDFTDEKEEIENWLGHEDCRW